MATEDQKPTDKPATGWSNAAKRRAGRRGASRHSHPLGTVANVGDGYTEYTDNTFGDGTGTVQIWDRS